MLHARDGSEGRRIVVRPTATMSTVEATTVPAQHDRIVDCGRHAAAHIAVLLHADAAQPLHTKAQQREKGGKTVSKARDDELTPLLSLLTSERGEH